MIYQAKHFLQKDLSIYAPEIVPIRSKGKHPLRYLSLYCGFDIETTTLENKNAYMYIWQFSINDDVVIGRTWAEWLNVLTHLRESFNLRESTKIIIWVANLGYEFQFMRKHITVNRIFAKEIRKPILVEIDGIEFRDCLQISGGSLAQLAKDYTKTQKLVGDLDYTIKRNRKTKLTKKELAYCVNDVKILSEFSEYIFSEYIKKDKYVPMTKTGLLRRQVKKGCNVIAKQSVYNCYPDYGLYKIMMRWVFRGGYVHANINHVMKKIACVSGVDYTSSYPARMNMSYFPVSPFREITPEEVHEKIYTHCVIFQVTFYGLTKITPHTIESVSKCVECVNPIVDNGRIACASSVTVWLTELDFLVGYCRFYRWSSMTIHKAYSAVRGKLPRYLLDVLNTAYIQKDKLKKAGLSGTTEYALNKSYVNSSYGLLVTRLVEKEILYTDDWHVDKSAFDFESEKEKAFLLPQWGVYVTAHARAELLNTVADIEQEAVCDGGDVLYCDTDSIKMLHFDKHKHLIEEYNDDTKKKMVDVCKRYNLPLEHFDDLGCFDIEYENYTSKFLGAKRYITTDDKGKTKVTVAGLPKNALPDYCEREHKDIYDVFNNNMFMDIDVATKNASCYNDEPHSDIIDGVRMSELSSIGIFPIPFTLKLKDLYLMQIESINGQNRKFEFRDYENKTDVPEDIITEVAEFILDYKCSIADVSKEFGISRYKIQKWLTHELQFIDDELYYSVKLELRKRGIQI